jgi:hypothetical protein
MKKIVALMAVLYSIGSYAQISLNNPPYQENFDNIANGLPAGFFVQTGSTTSAAGTSATFTPTPTSWNNTTGGFYNCASATGLTPTSNPNQQALSTNRALSVRQTASFGNPGAAFVFKIANTVNKTNFQLTFRMVSLDSSAQAITAWAVDYGTGANPTSFTGITTAPTPVRTGSVSTNAGSGYRFFTDVSVNFGTALDNKSDIVWIRVWAPAATIALPIIGNATPTMSGIDDWNLSWTNSPNTSINNINKANENILVSGFAGNDLRVDFKNTITNKTIIRLTDINGAVLWEKQYVRIQANQTEWVRPGNLNKGIYILQIQNAETRITKRIAN